MALPLGKFHFENRANFPYFIDEKGLNNQNIKTKTYSMKVISHPAAVAIIKDYQPPDLI